MNSIDYYNKNSQEFYDRTIHTNVSECYDAFVKHLHPKAHILDAGCGVGRDSKYFLSQGYGVTAFDASEKMVALAKKETGIDVGHYTFDDLDHESVYDGVWAKASLLHVPHEKTKSVYEKIHRSLQPNGVFFGSYKYGKGHAISSDRTFYHMDEKTIRPYFTDLFHVIDVWKERDTRERVSPQKNGSWLYFIVKKQK